MGENYHLEAQWTYQGSDCDPSLRKVLFVENTNKKAAVPF